MRGKLYFNLFITVFSSIVLFNVKMIDAHAESYNVWVGGIEVTDENADNVMGPGISNGSVRYDALSNTLFLEGATITGGINVSANDKANIYINNSDINIKGTSYLAGGEDIKYSIYSSGGVLNVTGESIGIDCQNIITAKGTETVTLAGRVSTFSVISNGDLRVSEDAEINISAESASSVGEYMLEAKGNIEVNSGAKVTVESADRTYYGVYTPKGMTIDDAEVSVDADLCGIDAHILKITNSVVTAEGTIAGIGSDDFTITESIVTASGIYHGLEGEVLNINSGIVTFISTGTESGQNNHSGISAHMVNIGSGITKVTISSNRNKALNLKYNLSVASNLKISTPEGGKNTGKDVVERDGITSAKYVVVEPDQASEIKDETEKSEEKEVKQEDNPSLMINTSSVIVQKGKTNKNVKLTLKNDKVSIVSSSKPKVATIKLVGNVIEIKGLKKGTSKITVETEKGLSKALKVTVQAGKVVTTKVKVSKKSISLAKKKTAIIKATATPDEFSTKEKMSVVISNKKVAIAKLERNTGKVLITGKKKGSCTITLKAGKKSATIKVKVK